MKANSGEILRLRLRMTSRLFLPQRAEQFSQLALDFQDRRKGLIGFQDDRRLLAPDSFGDVTDCVSAHLHGLAPRGVSYLLPLRGPHPAGKKPSGIGMSRGFENSFRGRQDRQWRDRNPINRRALFF